MKDDDQRFPYNGSVEELRKDLTKMAKNLTDSLITLTDNPESTVRDLGDFSSILSQSAGLTRILALVNLCTAIVLASEKHINQLIPYYTERFPSMCKTHIYLKSDDEPEGIITPLLCAIRMKDPETCRALLWHEYSDWFVEDDDLRILEALVPSHKEYYKEESKKPV